MGTLGWSMDSAWGFLSGFSLRGGSKLRFDEVMRLGTYFTHQRDSSLPQSLLSR